MRIILILFCILILSENAKSFDLDTLVKYSYQICEAKTDFSSYEYDLLKKVDHIYTNTNGKSTFNSQQVSCTYHQLSVHYYKNKNYIRAIECSKKAIVIRKLPEYDDGMLWKSYRMVGLSYFQMEYFSKAEEYLPKCFSTNEDLNLGDEGKIQLDLGLLYFEFKDFENSIPYCQLAYNKAKSYHLLQKTDKSTNLLNKTRSGCYESLIFSEDKKRINLALKSLNKEISLYEVNDSSNLSLSLNFKGLALRKLGLYLKSISAFDKALSLLPKEDIINKANILNNKATALHHFEKPRLAITYLEESYNIFRQILIKKKYAPDFADIYENLGENHEMLSKESIEHLDTAFKYYHKAVINYTNNYRSESVFSTVPYKNENLYVYKPVDLIRNLHFKARVGYKLYKTTGNRLYLSTAHNSYISLFKFQKDLYKQINSENSRLLQAETIVPYIESAMNVAFEIQDEEFMDYLFQLMELNKASVLYQSINESKALKYAGISKDILEREQDLKINITHYKKMFHEFEAVNDTCNIPIFKDLLNTEQTTYQQFIDSLEIKHPNYFQLKYKRTDIQLSQLQNQLAENSAILEYFIGESIIYVMTIQKEQVDIHKIKKPANWADDLRNLSTAIIENYNNYLPDAHALYKLILAKPLAYLNNNVKHLQIIPDAELNNIPFAALLTNEHQVPKNLVVDFSKLSYLAKQFYISYAYSSKLLLEVQKEKEKTTHSAYAAFILEDENGINKFCDQKMSKIKKKFNGVWFDYDDCTTTNFKTYANQYKMVHLITHGEGKKESNQFNVKLQFDDGFLSAADIYNINMDKNELVFFTACETSTGPGKKGEGVMSLSRAFTYAGCPSLVSTLWSVNSESTCSITEWFFDEIEKGKSIDVALWEAKRKYILKAKGTKAHPKYWAGIIPIGKMSPISIKN